jgi:hypothetical protein
MHEPPVILTASRKCGNGLIDVKSRFVGVNPLTWFASGNAMKISKQFLVVLLLSQITVVFAQPATRPTLSLSEAKSLTELMCHQLPNIGTIVERLRIEVPGTPSVAPEDEPTVTDDVHDTLLQLGPYSLNCLTDKLLDSRWMPDPRTEPLLGAPVVGDVAYKILAEKGVPDLLPQLAHKQPNELRMDDYFIWPSIGDHRQRLQDAVREWLIKHPDCCRTAPVVRSTTPSTLKSRMSKTDLEKARRQLSRFRLGMSPEEVLTLMPSPDAIDRGSDTDAAHWETALLGFCANDHNESLAYIYFIERWADEIARRDPLRDRYVIVFFSAEGKLTRMFSNVAAIAPILPPGTYASWLRLVCDSCDTPQMQSK